MDCHLGNLNVKAADRMQQTTAHSLAHAPQQEKKRRLIGARGELYPLPAAMPVPPSTQERFGVDFVPGGNQLAEAQLAQKLGHAADLASDEAEEEFYAGEAAEC